MNLGDFIDTYKDAIAQRVVESYPRPSTGPRRTAASCHGCSESPPILNGRTELVQRLLADTCELCGSTVKVQVHHVRAMKDLRKKGRAERPLGWR